MTPPRIGIVIVGYNSARELGPCIDSLVAQEGVRVRLVVIDNASSDGTAALVEERYPEVELIRNASNVGFARAVNQGVDRLEPGCDVVVLANPDTVSSPGVLAACARALDRHPRVGVVGPRLVQPDGSLHPSCHGFMGITNLLGEALGLDRVWPHTALGSLHLRGFAHDKETVVDWIQGAFLAVRPAAIKAVGGLDPRFFMYSEEMDWMLRMQRAGWLTLFLPGPPVMHVGGASSRPLVGPMFVELLKSRLRFVRKHRGRRVAAVAGFVMALGVLVRLAGWEILGPWLARRSGEARETVRLRRAMFRAGALWVARGLPLDPPRLEGRVA